MAISTVTHIVDTGYKNGKVECACGWTKTLGNGFNEYYIASCPNCDRQISTREQYKLELSNEILYGRFIYFVLSNGLHIQYSKEIHRSQSRKRR